MEFSRPFSSPVTRHAQVSLRSLFLIYLFESRKNYNIFASFRNQNFLKFLCSPGLFSVLDQSNFGTNVFVGCLLRSRKQLAGMWLVRIFSLPNVSPVLSLPTPRSIY